MLLALVGVTGILPFTGSVADVVMLGSVVPWWVPMLVVGVVATALAYGAGITAGAMLGSRLASFTASSRSRPPAPGPGCCSARR
ncbi:hypothetical protein BC477_03140 [Clavibacter michiganensis subsp. michiganensis]|uniref:Uncharacterized protein n=1 Tax=Clavibacter michiganensis subsp. michiganensis TaxID=33013 RepID=A0A251XJS8_CLAMM|nr:hypothetical protein BC477_03140 [Clavibacter michiganensis subsp. michiganensis]OUE03707.1 hypothetical protein CMMCAS07_02075 [Clavibacter michiganensis subsp. michiganensis]